MKSIQRRGNIRFSILTTGESILSGLMYGDVVIGFILLCVLILLVCAIRCERRDLLRVVCEMGRNLRAIRFLDGLRQRCLFLLGMCESHIGYSLFSWCSILCCVLWRELFFYPFFKWRKGFPATKPLLEVLISPVFCANFWSVKLCIPCADCLDAVIFFYRFFVRGFCFHFSVCCVCVFSC